MFVGYPSICWNIINHNQASRSLTRGRHLREQLCAHPYYKQHTIRSRAKSWSHFRSNPSGAVNSHRRRRRQRHSRTNKARHRCYAALAAGGMLFCENGWIKNTRPAAEACLLFFFFRPVRKPIRTVDWRDYITLSNLFIILALVFNRSLRWPR